MLLVSSAADVGGEEEAAAGSEGVIDEHVLILDSSNFTDVVAKHPFIVVEFYAPWCGHCKRLAPEYGKAAAVLSKHDPPIVLAKVDANEDINRDLATKYDVSGFPTLKILRNGGSNIQEYKGPREAEGIVDYLKKQVGPASKQIGSAEDASTHINDKKVFIVGVFSQFSGQEYDNFMAVAEKLRSDYEFGHTLDAKLLPKGQPDVAKPFVRLIKPFDELYVDTKDFNVDSLEKFVDVASTPLVTVFNNDPNNHHYVMKFFNGDNAKVMFFVNFNDKHIDEFKSKYHDAAVSYKGQNLSFLIGDVESSQGAFQYFGLKEDQVPLVIIQTVDGQKYLKSNIEAAQITTWLKDYVDGNVKPFRKSEPIPEVNNEPVKVVVADNIHDFVLSGGKNVLVEFYAPWCGHCQKLAPILDEVAVSFQNDPDVVIAKMDATANDVPSNFKVEGYPTLYFVTPSGKLISYEGGRTKEDIVEFIQNNRDAPAEIEPVKDEL